MPEPLNGLPKPSFLATGFTAETCGSCRFGIMFDPANLAARECRGVPPTPVLVNVHRAQGGKVGFEVEQFQPRVLASRPACGLHKPTLVAPGR